MRKDYKTLKRIPESIAGYDSCYPDYCYVRFNPVADSEKAIEFTTDWQPGEFYPPERYHEEDYLTSAGYIEMVDNGEWGGYLSIGDKEVLTGNFSRFFVCAGERFAVSSLHHMSLASFGLARIYDDGTAEYIYHSNKYEKRHQKIKDGEVNIGFDGYFISKGRKGHEVVYILCSGDVWDYEKPQGEKRKIVRYLLAYDKERKRPFKRIDLPSDKVEYGQVSSIWTDGKTLAIGTDHEVVIVNLSTMDTEYWTDLDDENIKIRLLEKRTEERW